MVFVVADHGGFALKERLVAWLRVSGIPVRDLGPSKKVSGDDYPIYATQLSRQVRLSPQHRGIAICRSGVGMAIVANKHRGIRAVQAVTPAIVRQSRIDENTNVLSLAADFQSWSNITATVKQWLATPYHHQPRHARRLRAIRKIEHGR